MILAAGKGTRMLPLTETTPKPLLQINNKTFIEYHIEALRDAGISDIVINVAHLKDHIINYLGDGDRYGVRLHYSLEEEPLDVAGGIKNALDKLGDAPFIVISSDIWTDFPLTQLVNHRLVSKAHLVLVDNPHYHPEGDFALIDGILTFDFPEKFLNYAGIGLFSPDFFSLVATRNASISPLFKHFVDQKALTGEYFGGCWMNVGTPEQLHSLKQINEGP